MHHIKNITKPIGLSAALLILSACSTTSPDYSSIARSEQALKQAKQVDAQTHSPYWFNEAEKNLDLASEAMSKKDYKIAKMRAEEASAAAELADVSTRNKKAQMAVNEIKASISALQDQLKNKSTE